MVSGEIEYKNTSVNSSNKVCTCISISTSHFPYFSFYKIKVRKINDFIIQNNVQREAVYADY